MPAPVDPWAALRSTTRARIGLGRTGDAPPLGAVLEFQLAHARARDAVHTALDADAVAGALDTECIVHTAAADRDVYLRRPDLGRRLSEESHARLQCQPRPDGGWDAVFIVADGLSPAAVQAFAPPVLRVCMQNLSGWSIAPVVVATQARVALGDEIGSLLGARLSVILIGERPGLSVARSLGVYLTYDPKPGRSDAERNCVSNIHPDGLSFAAAAEQVSWLMVEARNRRLTGVDLKPDLGITLVSPGETRRLAASGGSVAT
jgi:ethanolamine ammonia-lyase small subunit